MGGHSAMTTSNFHKWNEVHTRQDHVLWLQSLLMEGKTYKEANGLRRWLKNLVSFSSDTTTQA